MSYNVEGYMAEEYGDVSPESVLASGTSVCEGYSSLFEALAKAAGLEVITIGGWAKGYSYSAGDPLADANHAWNAVKIGDGWYLLDCTWGAGTVTKEANYIKRFEEFFFLTPPQDFVYGHLPEDPKWQLLDDPLSKSEFAEAPCRALGFFKYNLELGNPEKGSIKAENDITITVKTPENVVLSADLLHDDKNMPRHFISSKRSAKNYEIRAGFPEPGEYVLRVWAREKEGPEDPSWALDYNINVTEGNPDFKGFLQTGAAFSDCNLELESHNQYILEVEEDVVITIEAPENVLLLASLLRDNDRLPQYYTFCQRKDSTYQIKAVFPGPGEYTLSIFAKEKEVTGALPWALDYKVEVSRGIPKAHGFPETYSTFQESGAFLYSPMERNLQAGTMQDFKIEVPKALEVAVIINGQWHHLSKSGELFEGQVKVGEGDVTVFAKFPNEENFWGLLRYICE
ncbi:MAG: transglutaminase domain-containing protein [Dehalococcoidia bacterium]